MLHRQQPSWGGWESHIVDSPWIGKWAWRFRTFFVTEPVDLIPLSGGRGGTLATVIGLLSNNVAFSLITHRMCASVDREIAGTTRNHDLIKDCLTNPQFLGIPLGNVARRIQRRLALESSSRPYKRFSWLTLCDGTGRNTGWQKNISLGVVRIPSD